MPIIQLHNASPSSVEKKREIWSVAGVTLAESGQDDSG
jgi:hypothetical protein